jgi:hypothetical protein
MAEYPPSTCAPTTEAATSACCGRDLNPVSASWLVHTQSPLPACFGECQRSNARTIPVMKRAKVRSMRVVLPLALVFTAVASAVASFPKPEPSPAPGRSQTFACWGKVEMRPGHEPLYILHCYDPTCLDDKPCAKAEYCSCPDSGLPWCCQMELPAGEGPKARGPCGANGCPGSGTCKMQAVFDADGHLWYSSYCYESPAPTGQ